MSIQRITRDGRTRYRARVKHHGREVATQVFDRKNDAVVWEAEQRRRLRLGEWIDPRRGRVPLSDVAELWFESRHTVKRKTREADRAAYRCHVEPRFGRAPIASITPAEVAHWVGGLVSGGCSPSTASRYLATLRSILAFAVADGRVSLNAAASVRAPTAGRLRREGQFLTRDELEALAEACTGVYADLVRVLGLAGLRWGEIAGLKVADRVTVPGQGLRLQRAVLASSKKGELFVDTLKGKRAVAARGEEVLASAETYLIGKAGSALLARETVPFRSLAGVPLVLPSVPNGLRQTLDQLARRHGVRLDIVMEVDGAGSMKDVALSGHAYTLLPLMAVKEELQRRTLGAAAVVKPGIRRRIVLALTSQRPLSRAARHVAARIRALAPGLVR